MPDWAGEYAPVLTIRCDGPQKEAALVSDTLP